MIRVTIENAGPDGDSRLRIGSGWVRITVEGHSGTAAKGNDLVCAAVSTLSQACVVAISRVAEVRQQVVQRDGYLETVVGLAGVDEARKAMLTGMIGMMIAGLHEVAQTNPGTVEIIYI